MSRIHSQLICSLGTLSVECAGGASIANPSVFPTGTTLYDPAKAWNGYVIFSGTDGRTHLIDMDGNEVHAWNYQGFPSAMIDPAVTHDSRGQILVQYEVGQQAGVGTVPGVKVASTKSIAELDWAGTVV